MRGRVDAVQRYLGWHAFRIKGGDGLAVHQFVFIGLRTELIGVALRNHANERLQVIATVDEGLRQRIEEVRVRGRVSIAQVVLRLHEPALEEVLPIAIHQRLSEERIVLFAHPIDQSETRIFVGWNVERRLAKTRRLEHHTRLAVLRLRNAALVKDEVLARDGRWLTTDLTEEGRQLINVPYTHSKLASKTRDKKQVWRVTLKKKED